MTNSILKNSKTRKKSNTVNSEDLKVFNSKQSTFVEKNVEKQNNQLLFAPGSSGASGSGSGSESEYSRKTGMFRTASARASARLSKRSGGGRSQGISFGGP